MKPSSAFNVRLVRFEAAWRLIVGRTLNADGQRQ
jgi:hypothetical protein